MMQRLAQGKTRQWAVIWPRALGIVVCLGLLSALGVGAAVLVQPSLIGALRPWWPPLAAVGLCSVVAGYWLLWGRDT